MMHEPIIQTTPREIEISHAAQIQVSKDHFTSYMLRNIIKTNNHQKQKMLYPAKRRVDTSSGSHLLSFSVAWGLLYICFVPESYEISSDWIASTNIPPPTLLWFTFYLHFYLHHCSHQIIQKSIKPCDALQCSQSGAGSTRTTFKSVEVDVEWFQTEWEIDKRCFQA